ncbi:MAG: hypothetical protein A3E87_02850 [Gammaproteobacteria bacterium RIFCSPHIGHO2_12_FULL_35_23]|nr:MAG: hypothetical protein A3E87_02850 [Gammaproteobacteria bacterium RIFCSPHIGHO2_12_FULL_35_23]
MDTEELETIFTRATSPKDYHSILAGIIRNRFTAARDEERKLSIVMGILDKPIAATLLSYFSSTDLWKLKALILKKIATCEISRDVIRVTRRKIILIEDITTQNMVRDVIAARDSGSVFTITADYISKHFQRYIDGKIKIGFVKFARQYMHFSFLTRDRFSKELLALFSGNELLLYKDYIDEIMSSDEYQTWPENKKNNLRSNLVNIEELLTADRVIVDNDGFSLADTPTENSILTELGAFLSNEELTPEVENTFIVFIMQNYNRHFKGNLSNTLLFQLFVALNNIEDPSSQQAALSRICAFIWHMLMLANVYDNLRNKSLQFSAEHIVQLVKKFAALLSTGKITQDLHDQFILKAITWFPEAWNHARATAYAKLQADENLNVKLFLALVLPITFFKSSTQTAKYAAIISNFMTEADSSYFLKYSNLSEELKILLAQRLRNLTVASRLMPPAAEMSALSTTAAIPARVEIGASERGVAAATSVAAGGEPEAAGIESTPAIVVAGAATQAPAVESRIDPRIEVEQPPIPDSGQTAIDVRDTSAAASGASLLRAEFRARETSYREQIAKLRHELEQSQRTLTQESRKNSSRGSRREREITDLRSRLLEIQATNLREIKNLRGQVTALQRELKDAEAEREHMQEECNLRTKEAVAAAVEALKERATVLVRELEAVRANARREHSTLLTEIAGLKRRVAEAQRTVAHRAESRRLQEEENAALIARLTARLAAREKAVTAHEIESRGLREENAALAARLAARLAAQEKIHAAAVLVARLAAQEEIPAAAQHHIESSGEGGSADISVSSGSMLTLLTTRDAEVETEIRVAAAVAADEIIAPQQSIPEIEEPARTASAPANPYLGRSLSPSP